MFGATSAITEAEAKHSAVLQEATTAEEKVSEARAELRPIEQCTANDDSTAVALVIRVTARSLVRPASS